MAWEILLRDLGYVLTLVGTFLEGEITFMTSVYFATQGKLDLKIVILIGYLAILCVDNWWFYIGKKYGTQVLKWLPHLKRRAIFVQRILEKNQYAVVLAYRYIWGFRAITPIVLGTTHITRRRFFIYTIFTSAIWTTIFGSIGYYYGEKLVSIIAFVRSIEIALFTIATVTIVYFAYRRWEESIKHHMARSISKSRKIKKKIDMQIIKHTNSTKKQLKRIQYANQQFIKKTLRK